MTNADGNAGETPPSGQGYPPPQPWPGGYQFPPPNPEVTPPYPPAVDYPADAQHGYPPPPVPPPSFPAASGYPPPPGYGPQAGYPGGMPGYPGYSGGYGMPASRPTNNMAIGSLVASVLSLFLFFACGIGLIAGLIGLGLGVVALNQIKQSAPGFGPQSGQSGFGPQSGQSGHGLAIAGIAVGAFGTLANGIWILFFIGSVFAS